jgi:SnoaL-like domain
MIVDEFQAALERGDIAAASEMLADDVVFSSPAVFKPYEGKAATVVLLTAASRIFKEFRYLRSFIEEDALGLALMFEARIAGLEVQGIDVLRLDEDGKVTDFRVMIRPHTGLEALMAAMVPMIERVLAEQGEPVKRG